MLDVDEDSRFSDLQNEVAKATSIVHTDGNWETVVRLAAALLKDRPKDLRVASYLAIGWLRTRQSAGLIDGLTLYLNLLENSWETLDPEKSRMRGRIRALNWWLEKTIAAVQTFDSLVLSEDAGEKLTGRLLKAAAIWEALPEAVPATALLARLLREKSQAPKINQTPKPESSPTRSSVASIPAPSDERQAYQTLTDCARMIVQAHSARDRHSAAAYYLNRLPGWIGLSELPPADQVRTQIPPPEMHRVDRIRRLYAAGDDSALIDAVEEEVQSSVFWLDLHYFSVQALKNLGARYKAAADTVTYETLQLVVRLPGVERLSFINGMPFADEATLAWLDGLKNPVVVETPSLAESLRPESLLAQRRQDLRKQLRAHQWLQACTVFQTELALCTSAREEIVWRAAFVEGLTKHLQSRLLLVQLPLLSEAIDRYHLDEFEPTLAVTLLGLVASGYRALKDPQALAMAEGLEKRIGRIDLLAFAKKALV